LRSLQAHPPDSVALVHRNTSEFGYRFFGRDYGQKVDAWIRANYHPVYLAGAQPFRDKRFGILLFLRGAEGATPLTEDTPREIKAP
jgi:hypothetical protein